MTKHSHACTSLYRRAQSGKIAVELEFTTSDEIKIAREKQLENYQIDGEKPKILELVGLDKEKINSVLTRQLESNTKTLKPRKQFLNWHLSHQLTQVILLVILFVVVAILTYFQWTSFFTAVCFSSAIFGILSVVSNNTITMTFLKKIPFFIRDSFSFFILMTILSQVFTISAQYLPQKLTDGYDGFLWHTEYVLLMFVLLSIYSYLQYCQNNYSTVRMDAIHNAISITTQYLNNPQTLGKKKYLEEMLGTLILSFESSFSAQFTEFVLRLTKLWRYKKIGFFSAWYLVPEDEKKMKIETIRFHPDHPASDIFKQVKKLHKPAILDFKKFKALKKKSEKNAKDAADYVDNGWKSNFIASGERKHIVSMAGWALVTESVAHTSDAASCIAFDHTFLKVIPQAVRKKLPKKTLNYAFVKSAIACPIIDEDRAKAVVMICSRRKVQFKEYEINVLIYFCQLLGMALQKK